MSSTTRVLGREFWIRAGLWLLALGFVASRLSALRTEAINWDEFALLDRAARSLRLGRLLGAGRPGLGTLSLMPLVRGCEDAIAVVHRARLLTALAICAYLLGVFALLRRSLAKERAPTVGDAAFGVALLACVPAFLRWSLQVRTDAFALAFAIWAGVALVGSRSPARSLLAGVLFAVGFAFTQKVLYLLPLFVLLSAARRRSLGQRLDRAFVGSLGLFGLACLVSYGAYRLFVTELLEMPIQPVNVVRNVSTLKHYRKTLGFRVYEGIFASARAHVVLAALLVFATVRSFRTHRLELMLAHGALFLGTVVAFWHGAAFPYFYTTLGLFPALAGGFALAPVRASFRNASLARLVGPLLWLMLLLSALPTLFDLHDDTQRVQREALAFVERAFPKDATGFHPEGALFCRRTPQPFGTFLSLDIARAFEAEGAAQAFVSRFISEPVSFLVGSHRLAEFPLFVRNFWTSHYVPYGPLLVPGFVLSGRSEGELQVFVLVAGRYRLWLEPGDARLEHDGRELRHGDRLSLAKGSTSLRVLHPIERGGLVYDLPFEPLPDVPFYPPQIVRELDHGR